MIARSLQRLANRTHDDLIKGVSFNEASGEVCTPACRRKALLDSYHYGAQYRTFVHR